MTKYASKNLLGFPHSVDFLPENLVKSAEATASDLSIIRGVSSGPMEWCGLAVTGQNHSRVVGPWETVKTMLRGDNVSLASGS
jgi:hypothetical protein